MAEPVVPAANGHVAADQILRDLLETQRRMAEEIRVGDDEREITRKLLKKKGQPEVDGIWSSKPDPYKPTAMLVLHNLA